MQTSSVAPEIDESEHAEHCLSLLGSGTVPCSCRPTAPLARPTRTTRRVSIWVTPEGGVRSSYSVQSPSPGCDAGGSTIHGNLLSALVQYRPEEQDHYSCIVSLQGVTLDEQAWLNIVAELGVVHVGAPVG